MSYLNLRRILQKVVSAVTQPLTFGGIAEDGSDAKITIGTDGYVTVATPASGDKSTRVATTSFANSLLAAYEVTGAAVTTIDFTGLDINTHKSYRIEMELVNATASNSDIRLAVNGDTTTTNYDVQQLTANNTVLSATRSNDHYLAYLAASSRAYAVANILRDFSGYVAFFCKCIRSPGSGVYFTDYVGSKRATVTNITQLTFTASVAGSIGVGSKIRIYRDDV